MIEVKVNGVVIEPSSNMPVVILKDVENKNIVPIWIGPLEASSIILELDGIKSPRPMTHDLVVNFFKDNDIFVEKVIINDLKDNTYYARIYYQNQLKKKWIDSRPSDAIAIALRSKVPIYVEEKVLENFITNSKSFYKKYLEGLDEKELGPEV